MLIGVDNLEKIRNSKIAIFGIGGVGSYVVEGLVRAGVENFILVDNDEIVITNINRQIHATHKTIGQPKVEVMKSRIKEINANVEVHKLFYMPNCEEKIIDKSINYIIDAVDTVSAKIELITQAKKLNIPIISCMGTGNKMNPTQLEIADIEKTSVCPLAKIMRKELRQRGISKVKVLYSKEEPIKPQFQTEENNIKKQVPGSISFVPSVAGLIIASEVIKDIIKI